MMKASEFTQKLIDIATNYKTLYVMGCFGAPMTLSNKKRYTKNHSYNMQANRTTMINAASADTFGFDCVCLIKGILWGWNGDKTKIYGGASYACNNVPDVSADGMILKCNNVSTSNWSDMLIGEAVWCKGHIGVYIGNGLAVECTPAWKNKVQITAVKNIGTKSGYNARTWTKHGKLPYIEYDILTEEKVENKATEQGKTDVGTTNQSGTKKASDAAKSFLNTLAGSYTVTASSLNVRSGAGTNKAVMVSIPKGTVVRCYGYYTSLSGVKWLYVAFNYKNILYNGFCSSAYLKKN